MNNNLVKQIIPIGLGAAILLHAGAVYAQDYPTDTWNSGSSWDNSAQWNNSFTNVPPPPPPPPPMNYGSDFEGNWGPDGNTYAPPPPMDSGYDAGYYTPYFAPSEPMGTVILPSARLEVTGLAAQSESCPVLIQISEAQGGDRARPNGDFTGDAPLLWLGSQFTLTFRDSHKAVWRAPLAEKFRECTGRAVLTEWLDAPVKAAQSHLLVDFAKGFVTLTLQPELQKPGAVVVFAGVSSGGAPQWRWKQRGFVTAKKSDPRR